MKEKRYLSADYPFEIDGAMPHPVRLEQGLREAQRRRIRRANAIKLFNDCRRPERTINHGRNTTAQYPCAYRGRGAFWKTTNGESFLGSAKRRRTF